MKTQFILFGLLLMVCSGDLFGQRRKKDSEPEAKVSFEEIQAQCENAPRASKVRIAVSKFTVATNNAPMNFGEELREMLENAL